jgi:hypothetical protein
MIWDSSVGIATGRPEFDSWQYKILVLSTTSKPALKPIQPPIQ